MNSELYQGEKEHPYHVVHGAPIVFTPDEIATLDGTFGVPNRVAELVSGQVHAALAERGIEPDAVRFSGYHDADDLEHIAKSTGDFAGEDDAHEYFFTKAQALADGDEGPLAYAATDGKPAVGVYDLARLATLGYDRLDDTVRTTPAKLIGALLFEFRPKYNIDYDYDFLAE